VTTSIDVREREVQQAFEGALTIARGDPTATLHDVETSLWKALLALGRAMIALYLARVVAKPRSTEYVHDGARFVIAGFTSSEVGTRFGKVTFERPVGRRVGWRRSTCDRPIDRALGLCGGFSLATVMSVTRLCAQMAFANARATFAQFCEWSPSQRSTLRMVDAVGSHARPFLEQAPAPDDDGEVLVIQVDGGGAPHIDLAELLLRRRPHAPRSGTDRQRRRRRRRSRQRPRRAKGDKSKNAKVAFIGVLYTLRATEDGSFEGPIHKRAYATFESHAALFAWLHAEAVKRGYGTKRTLFYADGAEAIWDQQAIWFPRAEPCIDWVHIVEKIWAAGRCVHREGSQELATWVAERVRDLRGRGGAGKVITTLSAAYAGIPKTGPGNKGKREKLLDVMLHFSKHQHRMRYYDLRRADLEIATGAAEGTVRNLLRMRLDGPGMRWSRARSESVLHLRCILLNGPWDEFVAHLARLGTLQLASKPTPTQTYDAKKKKKKAA
jgi:hypothetical protein